MFTISRLLNSFSSKAINLYHDLIHIGIRGILQLQNIKSTQRIGHTLSFIKPSIPVPILFVFMLQNILCLFFYSDIYFIFAQSIISTNPNINCV